MHREKATILANNVQKQPLHTPSPEIKNEAAGRPKRAISVVNKLTAPRGRKSSNMVLFYLYLKLTF